MTSQGRNGPAPLRSPARAAITSPWLSAGLGIVLVVLAAGALLLPSLIGAPGASHTPAPTALPSASLEASLGPTPAPSFVLPTPSPNPSFTSYVVRPRDSLTSIAKAFRTTPRSLAWWNRGTYPTLDPESPGYDPNHLVVGWVLVLIPGVTVDENNPPTPSPGPIAAATTDPTTSPLLTPRPTVRPSLGPTPVPTAAPATVLFSGPRGKAKIALTFDMGGRLDPAVEIVQWLIDHHVQATLFPTGKTGSTTTLGVAALTLAAAHPDLFDFGNHSWDHPDFTTLTAAQMADQLQRTERVIAQIIGTSTKPWFRPPYGASSTAVRAGVGLAGWRYEVMWDVDTIDWKPVADGGPTVSQIVAKVSAKAQGGSIVLMHLGGYNTLEALPGILAAVEAKGLQPVTLGEMFGQ